MSQCCEVEDRGACCASQAGCWAGAVTRLLPFLWALNPAPRSRPGEPESCGSPLYCVGAFNHTQHALNLGEEEGKKKVPGGGHESSVMFSWLF